MRECRICSGPHDETLHAAALRVRAWFRSQVLLSIASDEAAEPAKSPAQESPSAA
jgi:hypothetical protein